MLATDDVDHAGAQRRAKGKRNSRAHTMVVVATTEEDYIDG